MTIEKKGLFLAVLLVTVSLGLIAACSNKPSASKWHPMEVSERPLCSDCHFDDRAEMNHSPQFATKTHGKFASQQSICTSCHRETFCMDCHANKEEIKAVDKNKDAPTRYFPHRGDYIAQHKIDGRINPAPCFRCHGRANNQRCKACHK